MNKYGFTSNQIAYIGDDINDLPALQFSGMSFAPKNAHPSVAGKVDYVLNPDGRSGAVRECIDITVSKI